MARPLFDFVTMVLDFGKLVKPLKCCVVETVVNLDFKENETVSKSCGGSGSEVQYKTGT